MARSYWTWRVIRTGASVDDAMWWWKGMRGVCISRVGAAMSFATIAADCGVSVVENARGVVKVDGEVSGQQG
jgi:hypothetical protein